MDHQSRLDAWDKCSGLVHWEDPEEWYYYINTLFVHNWNIFIQLLLLLLHLLRFLFFLVWLSLASLQGLPRWLNGQASACKCRRCRFDPWVGKIPWRRTWQPTPVFLPGESHGQRSLAGYSPWGRKELGMTYQLKGNSIKLPWTWGGVP